MEQMEAVAAVAPVAPAEASVSGTLCQTNSSVLVVFGPGIESLGFLDRMSKKKDADFFFGGGCRPKICRDLRLQGDAAKQVRLKPRLPGAAMALVGLSRSCQHLSRQLRQRRPEKILHCIMYNSRYIDT